MTQARFELDEYTTRVLDVVKGKYGLKSREEALNKFVREFGEEFLEYPVSEEYLSKLDSIVAEHEKKYGKRTISEKELDDLLEL